MKALRSIVLLVGISCATAPYRGPAPVRVGSAPEWTAQSSFLAQSGNDVLGYGVGVLTVGGPKEACYDSSLLQSALKNRAIAELGKLLAGVEQSSSGALTTEMRTKLRLVQSVAAWFDGTSLAYALVRMPVPAGMAAGLQPVPAEPSGGISFAEVAGQIMSEEIRASIASGACTDPYRAETACCGTFPGMCEVPGKYNTSATSEAGILSCTCGVDEPCRYDFECATDGTYTECRCAGPRCPCDAGSNDEPLNCKPGQYCLRSSIRKLDGIYKGCVDRPGRAIRDE